MRTVIFAKRCAKEILRDPVNLIFCFGFPVALLLLLTAIQANIPVSLFEIAHLTPGMTVFGLAFLSLFSATLLAKDRESAFLQRLYTTPLTSSDFILGYLLPLIPVAAVQSIVCYLTAFLLGLPVTIPILYAVLMILPVSVFYISLGLLCGSIFNGKQVGGICGALLTNVSAFLSGVWFDLDLVGETFRKIAYLLPFVHAVELERALVRGDFVEALPHIYPVIGYAILTTVVAVLLFLRQMRKQ